MFVKDFLHNSRAHISESERCFNVKFSIYYFHTKMKILADFQICISGPLILCKTALDKTVFVKPIIERYLENGVSKSIVYVIKHANVQLYRVHLDGVIQKT